MNYPINDRHFRVEVLSKTDRPNLLCYLAMHQEIEMSNTDEKFLVSLVDTPVVCTRKWHLSSVGYPATTIYEQKNKKSYNVYLHDFIYTYKPNKMVVDHINRNKLDNRRQNLRLITRSQNNQNTGLRKTNKSGYKGVSFHSPTGKWRATIKVNYKQKSLGLYEKAEEAGLAYNLASKKYFGEYGYQNEVKNG